MLRCADVYKARTEVAAGARLLQELQRLCVCARASLQAVQGAQVTAGTWHCAELSLSALSCSPLLMRLPSHTGCARDSSVSYPEPLPRARAALQAVLGRAVTWRDAERLPAGRHVMVSNHSTTGDLMVLYNLRRRCVHLVNAALPPRVTQARPHRRRGARGRACRARARAWPASGPDRQCLGR
jgi:hypothetical protein